MVTGRISKRTVDACQPGDKDRFLWDSELTGFGLKVTPAGHKVFIVQYRHNGRTKRVTIGQYGKLTPDQARTEAKRVLGAKSVLKARLETRHLRREARLDFQAHAAGAFEPKSRTRTPSKKIGSKPYTGILLEPINAAQIKKVALESGVGPLELDSEEKRLRVEAVRDRFEALFKHYGIDKKTPLAWHDIDAWRNLAIGLAFNHVPGIRTTYSEPGRPKGTGLDPLKVYHRVNRWRAECSQKDGRKPRVAQAAADLAKEFRVSKGRLQNLYKLGREKRYQQLMRVSPRGLAIGGPLRYQYALGPRYRPGDNDVPWDLLHKQEVSRQPVAAISVMI